MFDFDSRCLVPPPTAAKEEKFYNHVSEIEDTRDCGGVCDLYVSAIQFSCNPHHLNHSLKYSHQRSRTSPLLIMAPSEPGSDWSTLASVFDSLRGEIKDLQEEVRDLRERDVVCENKMEEFDSVSLVDDPPSFSTHRFFSFSPLFA